MFAQFDGMLAGVLFIVVIVKADIAFKNVHVHIAMNMAGSARIGQQVQHPAQVLQRLIMLTRVVLFQHPGIPVFCCPFQHRTELGQDDLLSDQAASEKPDDTT